MSMDLLSKAPHGSWDSSLAARIDHTVLRAEAQPKDIEKLCEEARIWQFAAVCVNPWYIPLVREQLQGTSIAACTVIGFPLGANTTKLKIFEAEQAYHEGATELDIVLNIGALKSGQLAYVKTELTNLRRVAPQALLKLILETCASSNEEIVLACRLAADAGFEFVKTSTGFGSGGALVEHVALMRASIPSTMQVKASGGIKERSKALELFASGATRIGSSQSVHLIRLESLSPL